MNPVMGKRHAELVALLKADLQPRYDPAASWGEAVSMFQNIPNLRGFWPFSSVDEAGNLYDLSGQARTLTPNGAVTTVLASDSIFNYGSFNPASSQYYSRADEAGLSITGSLTIGGWFYFNAVSATYGLMSKYLAAGSQRSYHLYHDSSNQIFFEVSGDGINGTGTLSFDSPPTTAGAWYFCVGRVVDGSTITVFLDRIENEGGSSPPTPIFNSTAPFEIGRTNGGSYLNGRAALCFVAAAALPSVAIDVLYGRTMALFAK